MEPLKLDPEKILELEFQYAQSTAEQAQDDRATIMNLYLILVGGVGSIVAGLAQMDKFEALRPAFAGVFLLLGITGFFILAKLVRLRQAWQDSAQAMNRIKEFYIARHPEIAAAFRWREKTIPPLGKLWTITFYLALLVTIIDSVSLAIAVNLMGWRVSFGNYVVEIFVALVYFAWQAIFYFYQLPMSKDDAEVSAK